MIFWYLVPGVLTDKGYGPAVSGKGSVIVEDGYVAVNDATLEGYSEITEDEARALLPASTITTMLNHPAFKPTEHVVKVTIDELGRISAGDFVLSCADGGFKVDDWLRLVEVDANGNATGAGLYPLVIDSVIPSTAGQVDLTFGMAIETT